MEHVFTSLQTTLDIVPQGKTTFEDIENAVYSNPGIICKKCKKMETWFWGHIYDDNTELTQQIDNGLNLFRNTNRAGEVYYTYQNSPDGEEVRLIPLATIGNDPAYWTWKDDTGKVYTPRLERQTERYEITSPNNIACLYGRRHG